MQDLMIDIETLGTGMDCPVISIGAAYFDLEKKQIGDTFYAIFDIAEQIDSRTRFADASTLKWWMYQMDAAKTVFKDGAHPTREVLQKFREWIMVHAGSKAKATKKCSPWGNGAGFDINIMESLFKDYKVAIPWLYYNVLDLRTFKRFVGKDKKIEKLGTEHNALDDVVSQINYMFSVI